MEKGLGRVGVSLGKESRAVSVRRTKFSPRHRHGIGLATKLATNSSLPCARLLATNVATNRVQKVVTGCPRYTVRQIIQRGKTSVSEKSMETPVPGAPETAVPSARRGRPRKHSNTMVDAVLHHAASGKSVRQIADLTGLPKSTVHNIKRNNES
jgi:hypothetical protein